MAEREDRRDLIRLRPDFQKYSKFVKRPGFTKTNMLDLFYLIGS
jgi:hypothetical protein